jgi:predicted AlkP superfamily phosphohydrolase/phosphomutase
MTPAGAVDVSKVCENARVEADRAVITLLPALDPEQHDLDALKEDLRRTFRADYEDDLCHFWIARELAPKMNADLITLYVSLIDIVQHKFWRYFEPQRFGDVEPGDARALGHAIAASYVFADYVLAQMLATLGEDTTLVLVSDHGAGAWAFDGLSGALQGMLKSAHPEYSGNHRLNGMLVMHGPGIKSGVELGTVRHEDVVPTVLALLGLAAAEDLPGRVLADGLEAGVVDARRSVIPTYQTAASEGSLRPTASASDAEVENKLRALGYIE